MIQNMLMTAFTPLSATNEINCWDNKPFVNKWPEFQQIKNKKCEEITRTIKRKPKRIRTSFTTDQLNYLEEEFSRHPYIDAKKRAAMSQRTKIGERQIKIWFQNRRMKKKRQSSESSSDCDGSSSISSPAMTSSIGGEASILQNIYAEAYSEYQTPSYNIEVSCPTVDEQYQLPQLPTYQNIQYHDGMSVYPTEYYPTTHENGYGFSENCLNQFYNTQAAGWYGYDVNGYPNDGISWQNV